MPSWSYVLLGTACLVGLLLGVTPAGAGVITFEEDFSTLDHCATLNTTAWWDTSAQELKLPPFELTQVGSYDWDYDIDAVAVEGNYAFVTAHGANNRFRVLDMSDPTLPIFVGSCDLAGISLALEISGDYAYVADYSNGLQIIDITNPSVPTPVSLCDSTFLWTETRDIAVAGDCAYLLEKYYGVYAIDISDPSNPTFIDLYEPPLGYVYSVEIAGDHAYISTTTGLLVLDISDPANLTPVGEQSVSSVGLDVAVAGDYALVANNVSIEVFDISDPTNPIPAGSCTTPQGAYGLEVCGDYVYVANADAGVSVLDISDPTGPVLIKTLPVAGNAQRLTIAGDHAFVPAGDLLVLKITDRIDPYLAGSQALGQATRTAIAGDYAFVANGLAGLGVMDVTDPTNPVVVGTLDTPGSANALAVAGDCAYIADGDSGFYVADITDPLGATYLGDCAIAGTAWDVALAGNHAYVATDDAGLQVIDIADPSAPVAVGEYLFPTLARGVAVAGNYAYVGVYTLGLIVLDISDPANPTLAGSCDTPGRAYGVTISGNYAYVADYWSGMQVIDISDPTTPVLVGDYDSPGNTRQVAVSGDWAFLADYSEGLQVVDISDPLNPALAGVHDDLGTVYGVTVSGDQAYVSAYGSGLRVVDVFQRTWDLAGNVGQSESCGPAGQEVLAADLTTMQDAGITWQVTVDGGGYWYDIVPDQGWAFFAPGGTDFRWRSMHTLTDPRENPTCTWLQVQFVFASSQIATIEDIPEDQGGQVRVSWVPSGYDHLGSETPITQYAVYRKIDGSARTGSQPEPRVDGDLPPYLSPPGDWDFVTLVPACTDDEYAVVVPTLGDSTIAEGMHYSTFFVRALTDVPGVHFDSEPDSGYSVDNLAPGVPGGFHLAEPTLLAWNESEAEDFNYFTVYGSAADQLDESAVLVGYTIATSMDITGQVYDYYHLTATDFSGNEGAEASLGGASAVQEPADPTAWALRGAHPNPLRARTLIQYDVPREGHVRLQVFDLAGRRVCTLADEVQQPGRHTVEWPGVSRSGKRVASGVYFVRMQAGGFSARERVVILE
jgi:hypothetical protein